MIRGQILHDKLDKDAGFPTHRLHSAIRDAVTSGRADESQGRRWALINKQANTGKHQSVIEGPVADGNDPKGDSVRSTASGVSGTEALLAKEAEDELTGNSVFLLSLANSLTVPSEVDVDQMHIVAFNAIFGNDGEEVDDSNLEFANGGIGAGTQVAFSDCVGSPLTDDENSHEDFQSSYPPFSGYCAFDGSDFSAFSGTSIEEGGSEHNHVENDKDVFAEDPDENKLPAEDTADENVLHDKTEKNKVFIEESVENPPCSLHADLHDGLDSATLRWADVVLDNNLHDKFENGSHVEKVTSLDDANEILHDEDLHEKVNGAEDKLHENIKIKPGTWTHAQIESIVAAPWRRRRRGSFTPLQLQHFDIAASDSSGDRPQEPTSPPGQFNFYTKPGFGIKDLLVDGMQYGHGDGTLPLDDDSRDDGQEISNSLETSILHDNDSNGMHDEILHEGMHDPAVLTKIETLMHGNENEMHDHELSNFHALHGKDKDIGADDSAALHGDSLHDADTNNSHGKKKEGFVNPDPVGFGRGGESRFYEEPDENAEKEGFVNPDPVGFGRGGEEKVYDSFGSDLHGLHDLDLHGKKDGFSAALAEDSVVFKRYLREPADKEQTAGILHEDIEKNLHGDGEKQKVWLHTNLESILQAPWRNCRYEKTNLQDADYETYDKYITRKSDLAAADSRELQQRWVDVVDSGGEDAALHEDMDDDDAPTVVHDISEKDSYGQLHVENFNIAASDSSGDQPQEPTVPPGCFDFPTKPGFGIRNLFDTDGDTRTDLLGDSANESFFCGFCSTSTSHVLRKIETLMHGNENEMHDYELSNFHALHGKDKDHFTDVTVDNEMHEEITTFLHDVHDEAAEKKAHEKDAGADDSAASHGDSLHDADTNNPHGKKQFTDALKGGTLHDGQLDFFPCKDLQDAVGQDSFDNGNFFTEGFVFRMVSPNDPNGWIECISHDTLQALVKFSLDQIYKTADRIGANCVLQRLVHQHKTWTDGWSARARARGHMLLDKSKQIGKLQEERSLWQTRAFSARDGNQQLHEQVANLKIVNSRLLEDLKQTRQLLHSAERKAEANFNNKLEHDAQTPGKIQLGANSGNSGKTRSRNRRGRNSTPRKTLCCAESPSSAHTCGCAEPCSSALHSYDGPSGPEILKPGLLGPSRNSEKTPDFFQPCTFVGESATMQNLSLAHTDYGLHSHVDEELS